MSITSILYWFVDGINFGNQLLLKHGNRSKDKYIKIILSSRIA
jgi:hypothetical protein